MLFDVLWESSDSTNANARIRGLLCNVRGKQQNGNTEPCAQRAADSFFLSPRVSLFPALL